MSEMTRAYKEKASPLSAREMLLQTTARLAAESGSGSAALSKGGLLYHFPTKEILIDATFREQLHQLDDEINCVLSK